MAKVIVTYDLCSPGRNYQPLYNAIARYPLQAKVSESCWLIAGHGAVAVYNDLRQYLDTNDRIFVAELSGAAGWDATISPDEKVRSVLRY